MKTFKFGQLLPREDICDREEEIAGILRLCRAGGRVIAYGPRRFGKTSVVKNAVMPDFAKNSGRSLAIYSDLFQVNSTGDAALRLRAALEEALSRKAGVKSFLKSIHNYLKHFRVEITQDPISGAPTIALAGAHERDERGLEEIFAGIRDFSEEYRILLVLDEFQDVVTVPTLEARLRSQIQDLKNAAVILMGSKRHVLREIFGNESNPFYGFGTDIEFNEIPRTKWLPYMRERFEPAGVAIKENCVDEICSLMNDVPNAIQELCQWITLSGKRGNLTVELVHSHLGALIESKSSRYLERIAALSHKEKNVLIAVANMQPVSSFSSTKFLQAAGVSATATRATISRLADYGILELSKEGCRITDPLLRLFLTRRHGIF